MHAEREVLDRRVEISSQPGNTAAVSTEWNCSIAWVMHHDASVLMQKRSEVRDSEVGGEKREATLKPNPPVRNPFVLRSCSYLD